ASVFTCSAQKLRQPPDPIRVERGKPRTLLRHQCGSFATISRAQNPPSPAQFLGKTISGFKYYRFFTIREQLDLPLAADLGRKILLPPFEERVSSQIQTVNFPPILKISQNFTFLRVSLQSPGLFNASEQRFTSVPAEMLVARKIGATDTKR